MAGDLENDPSAAALDLDNSEAYDSAEDEDFQLEEAGGAAEDSGLSSSEEEDDEAGAENDRPTKRRKLAKTSTKKPDVAAEQMELDSGDEITIQKAKSKKKKRKTKDQADEDDEDVMFDEDEEGGEGGFVKTRSMRTKIQEDRKPLAKIDGATIDVDALWAQMNAPEPEPGLLSTTSKPTEGDQEQEPPTDQDKENVTAEPQTQEKLASEDLIKIKRTYKFAGEMHTEEKLVPRDSAEAKLYLAETNGEKAAEEVQSDNNNVVKFRRPLRKISRFDPNPSGVIKKSWEKQAITLDQDAKGPKLNTVEKSRLDWAQYVDEEGIKDELNVHSKAKEGYLGRMDFLGRVDANREEERRNIRLKGL